MKELLYRRYKIVRPADGAVFFHDEYMSYGIRNVKAIVTQYEQYAYKHTDYYHLKRVFWQVDSWYSEQDGGGYYYQRRLRELKERQGQLVEVYWKTCWWRLIDIQTIHAEYIGLVKG